MSLIDHLFARDVVAAVARDRITGLAAVPPLWIQLAELEWPREVDEPSALHHQLRRRACRWPRCEKLRRALPRTRPFLMYGLTEAFRSHLSAARGTRPPAGFDRQGDSQHRDPRRASRRHALRGRRTRRARAARRARGARLLERSARRPPSAFGRCRRSAGELPITEIAVWSGRHGAQGRRRLPLLHRTARRDDQDLRLPRQPDRSRGGRVRHRGSWRMPLRSASPHAALGEAHRARRRAGARRQTMSPRTRRPARLLPRATAGVHGARTTLRGSTSCRAIRTASSTAQRSPHSSATSSRAHR